MAIVERKTCGGCGESSLEHEQTCWACGGRRFLPPGARLAGEPTICMDDIGTRTVMQDRRRKSTPVMPLLYTGVGLSFAFFMCTLGFWIGRASAPAPEPPVVETAAAPVPLPTPPSGFAAVPQDFVPSGVQAGPALPVPRVHVRTDQTAVAPAPVEPATPPSTILPTARPAARPGGQPPQPAGVGIALALPAAAQPGPISTPPSVPRSVENVTARPPATTPPPAPRPLVPPPPQANAAVVAVRNDTASTISISVEGSDAGATVAPGADVFFPLPSGSYQLRASGGGMSTTKGLAVANRRTYSLILNHQKNDNRDSLVIIEPAVDGN